MDYTRITLLDKITIVSNRIAQLEAEHYGLTVELQIFEEQEPSDDTRLAIKELESKCAQLDHGHRTAQRVLHGLVSEIAVLDSALADPSDLSE